MKTKTWILIFAGVLALCLGAGFLLSPVKNASMARITSHGEVIATVPLSVDRQIDVGGHNTVTVKDGKIAVTWADCPDHYCIDRGFRAGGTEIVCLPNRLVISFLAEQELDAVVG